MSKRGDFEVTSQLGALRRYAGALTRDDAEAEDLVHDALVRAYERRGTYRPERDLKSWLLDWADYNTIASFSGGYSVE